MPVDVNPFRFSGPLAPEEMIDRDEEADDLLALALGGHSFGWAARAVRQDDLLRRVLEAAEREGMATVLVDLRMCCRSRRLWSGSSASTAEGADPRNRREPVPDMEHRARAGWGGSRRRFSAIRTWMPSRCCCAARAAGGAVRARRDHEPDRVRRDRGRARRAGRRRQDPQRDPAPGEAATYAFAGSARGVVEPLFSDPQRPLLIQAVHPSSTRCRSRRSATTSRALREHRPRRRLGTDPAARVHARAPATQHDVRALPVATDRPRCGR